MLVMENVHVVWGEWCDLLFISCASCMYYKLIHAEKIDSLECVLSAVSMGHPVCRWTNFNNNREGYKFEAVDEYPVGISIWVNPSIILCSKQCETIVECYRVYIQHTH